MTRPIQGWSAAVTVAAICLSMMTACSSDDPSGPSSTGSSTGAATAAEPTTTEPAPVAPLSTEAEVKKVVGKLRTGGRGQLVRQIVPVIDTWWESAYLGGTWPRTAFGDAFPGFTQGATREAKRDKDLLSNADIGATITAVTATKRDVRLDVIAPSGRVAGLTARIALDFDATGDPPHQVKVRGRVFLTRKEGTWRIFGYDVRKTVK